MTIEEAIEWMQEEKASFERAPDLNGCPMTEYWQKAIDALDIAISALRQQDQYPDSGKMMPLTLDELNKRNDPVFVSIKDFPNGGYWCLCQNGYIIPPNGYGFMAKDRPNWVFYSQKPEEGTV